MIWRGPFERIWLTSGYDALQALTLVESGDAAHAREALHRGLDTIRQVTTGLVSVRVCILALLGRAALDLREPALAREIGLEAQALHAGGPPSLFFGQLIHELLAATERTRPAGEHGQLTPSEWAVLEQLATHYPVPRIAAALEVSPATVRSHIRGIYLKLGVHSRVEAVARATELGLIDG